MARVGGGIPKRLLTTVGDMVIATAVGTPARLAAGAVGTDLKGQGAGVAPAFGAEGASVVTLLRANSGSTVTTGAEQVDTVALSGLAAGDVLLVYVYWEQITQAGGALSIVDSGVTDNIPALVTTRAAADVGAHIARIMQSQELATRFIAVQNGMVNAANSVNGGSPSGMPSWTGAWTLALRSASQTAGGTLRWRWLVYKCASA